MHDGVFLYPGDWAKVIKECVSFVNVDEHELPYRKIELNDVIKITAIKPKMLNNVAEYYTVIGKQYISLESLKKTTQTNQQFHLICKECNRIVLLCQHEDCMPKNLGHHYVVENGYLAVEFDGTCSKSNVNLKDCIKIYKEIEPFHDADIALDEDVG